jgi:aryl-alcohol dehydrogenase-like predicted oxidoreductase
LDQVASSHGTTVSAVAIAWLLTQPTVAAPIASARTTEQLGQILPAAELKLTPDEIEALTASGA